MAERKRKPNQRSTARLAATGSNIRFESPKSTRKPKPHMTRVIVEEVNPVGGFFNFLREYAVVGLAVGFIIGLQAQILVKQLVTSFIDPAFQLFFGKSLEARTFTLHFRDHYANFGWGAFIYNLLSFFFVLAAIYAIVKIFNLDKLDKPKKQQIDKMHTLK